MNVTLLGQFWLVAVLLALTPGADWAYAITAGLRARSAFPSICGMLSGYALVIMIIAFGIGALVTRYPIALTVLTFAGAGYLVYLGTSVLWRRVEEVRASDEPAGNGAFGQFLRGAGVSAINPKGLLLLLALLPQFTSPSAAWAPAAQMLVLGSLHLLNCAVIYSVVALLARRLLGSRPRGSVFVAKASGVIMILLGISILIEGVLDLR
ncbi:LysE family translocator [Gryllotalpicola koreensis]|uniref:LysE family transporter n=1 Tax=Gryllotalpicola koreensis TaxID=993086 RepID=A0ABP8A146_9MICO